MEETATADLAAAASSTALVEACLARARAPEGQGKAVFTALLAEPALRAAGQSDARLNSGVAARRLEGVPISIKNLFDIEGVITLAGSTILADAPAAPADSPVVARLRDAGAVIVGATNMVEFAFSGVGLNPHYGTPLNPWDRATGRIPGGSSSGAVISVSDGMSAAAIGTDTGGSVRIPAALCGLVGYKASARRIPMQGMTPLAPSLDSVGVIARSLAECRTVADVLVDGGLAVRADRPLRGLRFGVVEDYVTADMDAQVAGAYARALTRLSQQGAVLEPVSLPILFEIAQANAKGGFSAAESYAWHRRWLDRSAEYDPRVLVRILRGAEMTAADYLDVLSARQRLRGEAADILGRFDAMLSPTTPIVAPPLSAFAADGDYARLNALLLRNPSAVNFLDGTGLSLPCHGPGEAPVGLMLWSGFGHDEALLEAGFAVERALRA